MTRSDEIKKRLEAALAIAENARALTKPESWKDYGASIDFKIELLPHMAVLAAEVRSLQVELEQARDQLGRAIDLLDRNTKPGYPMEPDTGECYYCEQGLCEDDDGYQDDELMSPNFHKPDLFA